MAAPQNTVSRTLDPASPVWIPFVLNIGLLAIIGGIAVYNHIDTPPVIHVPTKI